MISPASKRLVGFHLLSGMVHGLIIWLAVVPLWEKREDLPFEVRFQIEDPPKPPPTKKPQPKPRKPPVKKKIVTPPKKPVIKQEKPVPPSVKEPSPREEILSSPMGIPDFQVPEAPPIIATETPEVVETPPLPKGPPPVSKDDLDVTQLPDAERVEQQNMTAFYEADIYILFAGDEKTGIPVPGTDLCIDGTFLRTLERQKLTHTVTDYEKCWIKSEDDRDKDICPPSAETTTVYFNDYFRTLIEYEVKHCLEYDNSHCHMKTIDDETPDVEICRIDFAYEGIWADDTNFEYRCAQSEARMFSNPLEYTIRYMEVPAFDDERSDRPKQFHRVVRSIPQCGK